MVMRHKLDRTDVTEMFDCEVVDAADVATQSRRAGASRRRARRHRRRCQCCTEDTRAVSCGRLADRTTIAGLTGTCPGKTADRSGVRGRSKRVHLLRECWLVLSGPVLGELCWGESTQGRVGTEGVVLHTPLFDNDLAFGWVGEVLNVQQLVSRPAVEGLDEGVLPGCSRFDVAGVGTRKAAPFPQPHAMSTLDGRRTTPERSGFSARLGRQRTRPRGGRLLPRRSRRPRSARRRLSAGACWQPGAGRRPAQAAVLSVKSPVAGCTHC